MLDTTAGTPDWWLKRLWAELESRQENYKLLNDYYSGNHRLPEGHRRAREAYRQFQKKARTNLTSLVAESLLERLNPNGFRSGTFGSPELDKMAWYLWQANSFDVRSKGVMLAAIVHAYSYVLVIPNPDNPSVPIMAAKDPRCTITEPDPVNPSKVAAGMTWKDDPLTGKRHALLFLPDYVYEFTAPIPAKDAHSRFDVNTFAVTTMLDGQVAAVPNPTYPEVCLTPFVNRMDLEGCGRGEFEDVIDDQDRINDQILSRLVIAKMQAYRQRWMKGVKVEDENGNSNAPFEHGADLIWAVEDDAAAFGEFSSTDLTPILKAVEADIHMLAAITRTPPHYLLATLVNISGDALTATESGLVSKARERMLTFGESFERVMRLALRLIGYELPLDAELLWASPESRTLSETYDAASKAAAAGLPWRSRMELLGKSPQEIERLEAERMDDALVMSQYPQLEDKGSAVRYSVNQPPADTGLKALPSGTGNDSTGG